MSKIYLIAQGEYSDYHVIAAFSSEEKAKEFEKAGGESLTVEQYELDPPFLSSADMERNGYKYYIVYMRRNGDTIRPPEPVSSWSLPNAMLGHGLDGCEDDVLKHWIRKESQLCWCCTFYVAARDEQHAVKIANERRAQMIANGKWPEERA